MAAVVPDIVPVTIGNRVSYTVVTYVFETVTVALVRYLPTVHNRYTAPATCSITETRRIVAASVTAVSVAWARATYNCRLYCM